MRTGWSGIAPDRLGIALIKSRTDPEEAGAASRRVVARFCFEVGWFGMIAFVPAALGVVPAATALAALGTYCSFAALLRVFIAARRGERPCAASLNSWDECLALVGAALLAYFAARVLG